MRSFFSRFDRGFGLGFAVLGVSTVLFTIATISIFVALGRGGPDLPSEGSIDTILGDASPGASNAPASEAAPLPPAPTRMEIPRLYIDAPVVTMTYEAPNTPAVPDRPDQVAWYDFTYRPGQANNAVFAGHVDWQTRTGAPIPGVFYRLRELEIGDLMKITREDGTQLQYRVTGNVATAYEDPNIPKAMGPTTKDSLTLITCGGTWLRDQREKYGGKYSHRIVVRAERVLDVVADVTAD